MSKVEEVIKDIEEIRKEILICGIDRINEKDILLLEEINKKCNRLHLDFGEKCISNILKSLNDKERLIYEISILGEYVRSLKYHMK